MSTLRPILSSPLLLALLFGMDHAAAQCPFDPTIIPAAPILCPNTQETLITQAYDAYQWYKDGAPIPGANGQSLIVDAYADGGSQFHVAATLAGCTEASPQVLVDGWAFLSPTVMTVADPAIGETPDYTIYCEGASVILVMMQPYDTNIQWTNMGVPIPGATNDTLVVTADGQYSTSGAPAVCPDFVQDLGVQIGVIFNQPIQPDIVLGGPGMCAYPAGESYQWYLNGEPIPDGNTLCISPEAQGSYVVEVTYLPDCSIPSEPSLVTGIQAREERPAFMVHPQPARDQVKVRWSDGTTLAGWQLLDATGRIVKRHQSPVRSPFTIDVQGLGTGFYWLLMPGSAAVPVVVE